MIKEPWGYHLLLDCGSGDIEKITNKNNIAEFVKELVKKIDMVAFGDLWIERFATHDPDKAGISFLQMIETSNITGHFVEKNGDFYLDVFSCKPFDKEIVVALTRQYFSPKSIRIRLVERDVA